jgi:hypothetical protein
MDMCTGQWFGPVLNDGDVILYRLKLLPGTKLLRRIALVRSVGILSTG